MPDGRDVFARACHYMPEALDRILKENNYSITDLTHIITHQANKRIIDNIVHQYKLPEDVFLSSIEELGNTGSAGVLITLAIHFDKLKKNDLVGLTVFGGGYSCGSLLMRF